MIRSAFQFICDSPGCQSEKTTSLVSGAKPELPKSWAWVSLKWDEVPRVNAAIVCDKCVYALMDNGGNSP